jgi:hypothetical protein
MNKTPVKGTHTRARGLWPNTLRITPRNNGELGETRARLGLLIASAQEKTGQISALLREKTGEQARIQRELTAAFSRNVTPAHHKALVRARIQLENHLRHTMQELETKRSELKKIYSKVNSIKEHIRKGA